MGKTNVDIRIGTSGWHYNDWAEKFYPARLPRSKWLEHYADIFDTVEINNTFYQLPKQQTIKKWYQQVPKNFTYSVKANRYITHIKRLKQTAEPLERFSDTVSLLKEKLGPILYQLPPSLHKDTKLLEGFLKLLPEDEISIFEFRHKSWFSQDTLELLDEFRCGFCIHDMPGIVSPREVTGRIIYIRFHGPTGRYAGNYSKAALKTWAQWIKKNSKKVSAVYVYFNNDINANAVRNAQQLKAQLGL